MFKITTYPNSILTDNRFKSETGSRCIIGDSEEISCLKDLVKRASEVPVVLAELVGNRRGKENFIRSNAMIIDVDDHMSINDCLLLLDEKKVEFAIYTSISHTAEKNKFHVIFPLAGYVTNMEDFKATYEYIANSIFEKTNDIQTSSAVNLFYNGKAENMQIETNREGSVGTKMPVIKGKPVPPTSMIPIVIPSSADRKLLSKRTMSFMIEGKDSEKTAWHEEFRLAAKNLKAAGFSIEEATAELLKISGKLTDDDVYQIKYAYQNSTWNYDTAMIEKDPHILRLKFTDAAGKKKNIPAQDIVKAFFYDNNVRITAGGSIKSGVSDTDLAVLKESIRHFAESRLQQKTNLSIIESVISFFINDARLIQLDILKENIKFTGATFDYEKWSTALLGKVDLIVINVMKHFIWQIKRKLAGKEVKYPMMPVFYGKSGAGKSYHLRQHILAPIKDIVYFDGDFTKLVDSREAYNLASHYVYFLDEMSKAEHADVESIKNKITSDTIQYRKLGTNETVRSTNKVTFVGTTNLPLSTVIKDPTSVRRFFEIKINERMDFTTISSMNYKLMWQSIDESIADDPFFIANQGKIEELQETFRHKSIIEEFLIEHPFSCQEDAGESFTQKETYDQFRIWVADSGYRHPINKHSFLQTMLDKVGTPVKFKKDKLSYLGYLKVKTNIGE